MHKVRIQFSKDGALKFIGHLDFLRVFQQALRRSGLPVAYSQGFNPHILLSFALPLPLGMASLHDYADLTLAESTDMENARVRLQEYAPLGLTVLTIWEADGRSAAAVTEAADYILTVKEAEITTVRQAVHELLAAKEYIIAKKTKGGIKDTDIRSDIIDIKSNGNVVTMRLSAGSGRFLNPMTVAAILLGRDTAACEMIRAELFKKEGEILKPLY
ncbi:MAG: TIGR03936 family radical SAM-associated protein [Defluviitaleaceae bacterium]|nr:TIGR03936 family radical SAM-associated protein [Defluviitaleaceae bacterium]